MTVFRSRLRAESQAEYLQLAAHMSALAKTIPGYISHKGFTADDGERVTIVEFESEGALRTWATHPDPFAAKREGRRLFFSEYRVQICNVSRDSAARASAKRA